MMEPRTFVDHAGRTWTVVAGLTEHAELEVLRAENQRLREQVDDLQVECGELVNGHDSMMAERDSLRAELADLWNLSRRIVIRYKKALQTIAALTSDESQVHTSRAGRFGQAVRIAGEALSGEYDPRFEEEKDG